MYVVHFGVGGHGTLSFPLCLLRPAAAGSDVLPPWKQGELVSESSYTSRTSVSSSVTQLAAEQRWEHKVTEVRRWSLGTPHRWTMAFFVIDSLQRVVLFSVEISPRTTTNQRPSASSATLVAQEATGSKANLIYSLFAINS